MKKFDKRQVINFVKKNKWTILKIGIMAGAVVMMPDTALAVDNSSSANGGLTVISGPIEKFEQLMSGEVAKAFVTMGVVIGGASWAMNLENQVVKAAMRVVGGGSVAIGGTNLVTQAASVLF